MTLKEFYKRARRVKWAVRRGETGALIVRTKNRVRGANPKRAHQCPLSYVTGTWNQFQAGAIVTVFEALMIASRADGRHGWRGRYRLKRALGLAK